MDLPAAAAAVLLLLPASPRLSGNLPEGWAPLLFRKVPRPTEYSWDAGERAVHAKSSASSSGLIARLDRAVPERPILRWRWKVAAPLPSHDERVKSGDDFPARVYVTFRYDPARASLATRAKYGLVKAVYGEYPPQAGIAYVWSSREKTGADWPNPFTERVRMVAVRSGREESGRWVSEERDLTADYRAFFGSDPPLLSGVALMTDTDQTGLSAEAWYADVSLGTR